MIQRLIPDRCFEAFYFEAAIDLCQYLITHWFEHFRFLGFQKQIHFVEEAEDFCFWGQLRQRIQTILKLIKIVTLEVFAGHIKHMNEYFNVAENVVTLTFEELLHKQILASTIPQLQYEVAEEADARFWDVDCESYSVGFAG